MPLSSPSIKQQQQPWFQLFSWSKINYVPFIGLSIHRMSQYLNVTVTDVSKQLALLPQEQSNDHSRCGEKSSSHLKITFNEYTKLLKSINSFLKLVTHITRLYTRKDLKSKCISK